MRRLSDAQARIASDPALNDFEYVEPGMLWWAFNGSSAALRGAQADAPASHPRKAPVERNAAVNQDRLPDRSVLLIDEIDKADPDVPNSLLVALGSFEFVVEETGTRVTRLPTPAGESLSRLLVIFTTNEERDLPDAFIRRSVVHWLEPPSPKRLVEIAQQHLGASLKGRSAWRRPWRRRLDAVRKEAQAVGTRPPSTAEYLDALRACLTLRIDPDSPRWKDVERTALRKPARPPGGVSGGG